MLILVVIMLHYVIINIKLTIYILVLDLSQGLAMPYKKRKKRMKCNFLFIFIFIFIFFFLFLLGCFSCSVIKSSSYKLGWEVQLNFQIKLHVKDFALLLAILRSLGGIGTINSKQSSCAFKENLRSFFFQKMRNKFLDKYPLISLKRGNYLLFKQIVSIMQLKEHNTLEGLQKIINIRAT